MNISNFYMPTIVEKDGRVEKSYDVLSRLLRDRIVYLNGEVNDETSCSIIAQMLYLEKEDPKADINFYINSPGGLVTAGLGIFDVMNFVQCHVKTLCIGQAASMGSFLLAAGEPGKRFSLPNSRIMIHQPLGGASGQATDVQIQANELLYVKEKLTNLLFDRTLGKVQKDVLVQKMERDCFLSAKDSLELGLIDRIV